MDLRTEIKDLIIKSLDLEDISADDIITEEPLFQDGLGLDSIDALEIGIALQKKYNITISSDKTETKKHFYSVETLAKYVESLTND